ncbi:MAG: hypothetical protein AAGG50_04870 [Bacteroidota bacterium]
MKSFRVSGLSAILAALGVLVGCRSAEVVPVDFDPVSAAQGRVERLVPDADTALFLVAFDIQTGLTYGTVWTPTRAFDFVPSDSLTIDENTLTYSDFVIQHLVRWDTSAVRAREVEQGGSLGGSLVKATRIVRCPEEQRDSFAFVEFFDSARAPQDQPE